MSLRPVLVIVGPTAVGKTELSIQVAKRVGGEIISADSMQIYRGLDIGTAKPTLEERQGVPHHLLDVVDPSEEFSVAEYQRMADEVLQDIARRNRIPILVGGTGLYVRAVLEGFVFEGEGKDPALRSHLQRLADKEGNKALYDRLQAVDPATAARLHPNDRRRIIRALEVYHTTGKPLSVHLQRQKHRPPKYPSVKFGLYRERAQLYERINRRVDKMMKAGLLGEVRRLLDQGLSDDSTAMQALGYKELVGYLRGEYDLEEAIRLLKRNTRRYAKRQYTWFRRDPEIMWINLGELDVPTATDKILDIYCRNFPNRPRIRTCKRR